MDLTITAHNVVRAIGNEDVEFQELSRRLVRVPEMRHLAQLRRVLARLTRLNIVQRTGDHWSLR